MKKKAIVSACLLGEVCRYDGETKKVNAVLQALDGYEIIPFCPEAPLFGTPRERISVVAKNGENRIITDETNVDVTQKLEDEICSFMEQYPQVDRIILKSKSPSCGYGTTPVLDSQKKRVKFGNGIAATMFKAHYKNIPIQDELSFIEQDKHGT